MDSAIQHTPVMRRMKSWKRASPWALRASSIVKVGVGELGGWKGVVMDWSEDVEEGEEGEEGGEMLLAGSPSMSVRRMQKEGVWCRTMMLWWAWRMAVLGWR